jgi:FKBP-type peptidyl-prolyl cis-trans isomerase 2
MYKLGTATQENIQIFKDITTGPTSYKENESFMSKQQCSANNNNRPTFVIKHSDTSKRNKVINSIMHMTARVGMNSPTAGQKVTFQSDQYHRATGNRPIKAHRY